MLVLASCVTAEPPKGADTGCEVDASWFADGDGDGLGDPRFETSACSQPANYVRNADDCDDGDAAVGGPVAWHEDKDGDGFGWEDEDAAVSSCSPIAGWVEDATDCNDLFDDVHPGAPETCNMRDDDCDDLGDEDAIDAGTLYVDDDGDGFGVEDGAESGCYLQEQEGWVWDAGDCDDTDPEVHPDAAEHCDGRDENCDDVIDDDGVDPLAWYLDLDGDGFGRAAPSLESCGQPEGYAATDDDCDDDDADVYPEASERCDGVDEDCDGTPDDDALDAATWYSDADGDGFGDAAVTAAACDAPSGFLADATDCDDTSASISPVGAESCGGADEDCDGATDEDDAVDAGAWYADADGDGFGGGTPTRACTAPAGTFADGEDCDDADAGVNPDAVEVCGDGLDNDCDGATETLTEWYADADGDGYGDAASPLAGCELTEGYVADDTDCDDADAAVYPSTRTCRPAGAFSLAEADAKFTGVAGGDAANVGGFAGDVDGDGIDDLVASAYQAGDSGEGAFYVVLGATGRLADGSLADAWATYEGEADGDQLGYVGVVGVGDTDKDGADDVLVSAFYNEDGGLDAGAAWLLRGLSAGSRTLSGSLGAEWYGADAGDLAGCSIAAAGDVVGDATPDLLIGACYDEAGGVEAGAAYAVDGSVSGNSSLSAASATLIGEDAGDEAGTSVAGTGDTDGDGFDDILVGARYDDTAGTDAGAAYLLLGPVSGGDLKDADLKLVGEAAGDNAGHVVFRAGDVDGDGLPDLGATAPGDATHGGSSGAIYVVYGRGFGTTSPFSLGDAEIKVVGEAASDDAGAAVSAADMDGDLRDDLLIAASGADGGGADAGGAYLLLAPAPGTIDLGDASLGLTGDSAGDQVSRVAGAGDLDGDGWNDILAGAAGDRDAADGAGAVWVWYGDGF